MALDAAPGALMLVAMSTSEVSEGFCFLCGETTQESAEDHFATRHQGRSRKPKVDILTWMQRLDNIESAIREVRQGTDIDAQIRSLDQDVIQELYLVRARLAQLRRYAAQKGTNNGSS